jgi:site-specific DNA-methyltransferase (adenine-specific)
VPNTLYYGDNLGYLREMDCESVDLIYLDPPFNSNANYNLLFKSKGNSVQAQTTAFQDTWSWLEPAERAFNDVLASGSPVTGFLSALRASMGDTNLMAYLAMMTVRLIEMRRILRPNGSLYLHCDPTASHYLKVVLDGIFGVDNYRNEITWKRTAAHGVRWTPSVGQVAKGESLLGTAAWPKVRHGKYTEEAQS